MGLITLLDVSLGLFSGGVYLFLMTTLLYALFQATLGKSSGPCIDHVTLCRTSLPVNFHAPSSYKIHIALATRGHRDEIFLMVHSCDA